MRTQIKNQKKAQTGLDAETALSCTKMRTSKPPQQPPPPPDAAERRLREAEQRLKEAIEELQRRQLGPPGHLQPPCDHANESCVAHAVGNLCQSFLLSYGIRVGIGILLRAFKLARLKSYSSLLDIKVFLRLPSLFENEIEIMMRFLFYIPDSVDE